MTVREHGFKAEVQQLLDLMIHSLYSDREIFLRELISNAADALDKARFLALTRSDLAPVEGEPGIRITADPEAKTVVIEDDGIGMTEEEVVEHLGTIAHSGSRSFLEKLADEAEAAEEGAPRLIGQFGVGFYSSFMVAERVEVETRSALPDAAPVVWASAGQGTYTVQEGTRTHRGTRITLHLREDAAEFADVARLRGIVTRHSNFVPWPILVDGEQANTGKALWAENPSAVTDEEANAFYKSLTYDWVDPALRIHVKVDSPIQYSALLFVPGQRPFDLFNPEATTGPRLYAKRVLITEHASDLLPKWLRFVRGVVDSEDIQLNVSREMVQKTPVVRKIRTALVKRILKELAKVAAAEAPEEGAHPYEAIWQNFGVVLKEGYYYAGEKERELLLPLLRFDAVSRDDDAPLLSLAAYKEAMPEGQDTIWVLTAESREAALASPHLEVFRKRGWDVLLLTDPVDEWLLNALTEFEGVPLKSISRGELELDDEDDDEDKAELGGFNPWLKTLLGDAVTDVRASARLTDSPCVLVDSDAGISANLERILREANQDAPEARRVLELNPKHPLIKNLVALHAAGRTSEAEPIARLLYDDAMLLDGNVKDPAATGRRLQALLEQAAEAALHENPATS